MPQAPTCRICYRGCGHGHKPAVVWTVFLDPIGSRPFGVSFSLPYCQHRQGFIGFIDNAQQRFHKNEKYLILEKEPQ